MQRRIPLCWRNYIAIADVTGCTAIRICSIAIEATTVRKCEICIGEALMAQQLSEQGSPVDQIRDAIRRHFAGEN